MESFSLLQLANGLVNISECSQHDNWRHYVALMFK